MKTILIVTLLTMFEHCHIFRWFIKLWFCPALHWQDTTIYL